MDWMHFHSKWGIHFVSLKSLMKKEWLKSLAMVLTRCTIFSLKSLHQTFFKQMADKKGFWFDTFFHFYLYSSLQMLLLTIMPFGSMSFGRKAFGRKMICQHTQYKPRTQSSKIESLSKYFSKNQFSIEVTWLNLFSVKNLS